MLCEVRRYHQKRANRQPMQIAPLELLLIRSPERDHSLPELVIGHVQRFGNAVERLPSLNRPIAPRPLLGPRRLGDPFCGLRLRVLLARWWVGAPR